MTENDQKKELVFKILDELKQSGDRINADKVARMAKMGKQTVLPYYNEWRFLDDSSQLETEDLPVELIRTLKRLLIQWKHDCGESQRQFEEQANGEIDRLQIENHSLRDESDQRLQKAESLSSNLASLKGQIETLTDEIARQRTIQAQLEERLTVARSENERLKAEIPSLNTRHEKEREQIAEKLDRHYQKQVDHWMNALDEERRAKSKLDDQLESEKQQVVALEKQLNSIRLQHDKMCKENSEANAEIQQLKSAVNDKKKPAAILDTLTLLLGCPEDQLILCARRLITTEQEVGQLQRALDDENSRRKEVEKQLSEMVNSISRQMKNDDKRGDNDESID